MGTSNFRNPPIASLRWCPHPWMMAAAVASLLPTLLVWAAALGEEIGLRGLMPRVEAVLPPPDAALPVRIAVGWSLTMILPMLAALLSFLAYVHMELQVCRGEIRGALRFPTPMLRPAPLLAAAVVLLGIALAALMAGHLLADCLLAECSVR